MGEAIFTRYPKANITATVANSNYANSAGYSNNANHAVYANIAVNANKANYADKLSSGRIVHVNLSSTSGATFWGNSSIYPGVQGILPITRGGTGVNSLANLKNSLGITNLGSATGGGVWKVIKNYNVPGKYTFTVPDLFSGKNYTIGVAVISAGFDGTSWLYNSSSSDFSAVNINYGLPGNIICFTKEVKPGSEHNIVVGTRENTNYQAKSSAFDTMSGGYFTCLKYEYRINVGQFAYQNEGGYNPFEYRNVMFSSGSIPSIYGNVKHKGLCPITKTGGCRLIDYYTNNNTTALTWFNAYDATAPGCGGGSVRVYRDNPNHTINTARIKPGKAGNGAVIIYVTNGL